MTVSIYFLRNKRTGRVYVGSSKKPAARKSQHRSMMRLGKHPNRYLQNDFDKYGEANIEFLVVEEGISEDERFVKEQEWMDKTLKDTAPVPLYNMQPFAGRTRGRPISEETRRKQSIARKGKPKSESATAGIRRANYGRVFSQETRKKISDAHLSRPPLERKTNTALNESEVIEIYHALQRGDTLNLLAMRYGVGTSSIWRIKAGVTWSDVTDKLREG